jgi:uncharacterized protein (TIGR03437 family)
MRFSPFSRFGLVAILLSLPCWALLPPSTTTCVTPSSAMFGAPVTIAIGVSDDSGLFPTGTVEVSDNGNVLGVSGLDPNGAGKITAVFTLGLHAISCNYSGDAMLAPSVSGVNLITVVQDQTAVVLTASQNPVPVGQRVQIDVRVSGLVGAPVGAVTLKDGDTIFAALPLQPADNYSSASFIGIFAAGTHIITGSYDGDAFFSPATTAQPLVLVVGKRPTSTVFRNVSPSPAANGQPVVFQIQVVSDAGSASGSVTLTENSKTLGTGTLSSAAQTAITLTGLSVGTHSIVANYGGDQDFGASTSTPFSLQVTSGTAVQLSATPNPVQVGHTVTLTATVTSSAGVPSGTVTFTAATRIGQQTLGTANLNAAGQAVLMASFSATGTQTITAFYAGFTSAAVTLTVIPQQLVVTNSASFKTTVAPDSLASIFGDNLVASPVSAALLPWPFTLGGISVIFRDATGVERFAALKFVSPGQINAVVPPELSLGQATVIVRSATADVETGQATIANVAPGIFSGDGTGAGPAAAAVLTVHPDGSTSFLQQATRCDGHGNCIPNPIDLGTDGDQNFLMLYGVGIRRGSQITKVRIGAQDFTPLYAGPQAQLGGVDQVNVALPASLRGAGNVTITIAIGDQVSNTVVVNFK